MRAKLGRGERKLEEALAALTRALDTCGAPWMIIGGIAIIARGVRRMTTDIDAVVRGDAVTIAEVSNALARRHIHPRIDGAVAFAEENLVLLARHSPTGVDLDVSFGWTPFELEALEDRAKARYGGVFAPMATAEDLIVLKSMAGRAKDIDDVEALLELYPKVDVRRIRTRLEELSDVAGEPALVDAFDEVASRIRLARRPLERPRRSRRR